MGPFWSIYVPNKQHKLWAGLAALTVGYGLHFRLPWISSDFPGVRAKFWKICAQAGLRLVPGQKRGKVTLGLYLKVMRDPKKSEPYLSTWDMWLKTHMQCFSWYEHQSGGSGLQVAANPHYGPASAHAPNCATFGRGFKLCEAPRKIEKSEKIFFLQKKPVSGTLEK